jgi:hypothetical protein
MLIRFATFSLAASGAIGAAVAQPADVTRLPTVPQYVDRNADVLADELLRKKRPNVTRTAKRQVCGAVRSEASNNASLLVRAAFQPGGAEGNKGDHWEPRNCRNTEYQVPYAGARAKEVFVEELVDIAFKDPVRVAIPDFKSELLFDLPNCTKTFQSLTQSISYQTRQGEQVIVTHGIQTSRTRTSSSTGGLSLSIPKIATASGSVTSGSSSNRTISDSRAQTTSFDTTTTHQATIPLRAPPMSRVRATAGAAQFSYELPFTMRVRINGTLNPTTQYGENAISTELTADERVVEVQGFARVFDSRDIEFRPVQTPLTDEQCGVQARPMLSVNSGRDAAVLELPVD